MVQLWFESWSAWPPLQVQTEMWKPADSGQWCQEADQEGGKEGVTLPYVLGPSHFTLTSQWSWPCELQFTNTGREVFKRVNNLSEFTQPGRALGSSSTHSLGTMWHQLPYLRPLSVSPSQLVGHFLSALKLMNSQRKCSLKLMPLLPSRRKGRSDCPCVPGLILLSYILTSILDKRPPSPPYLSSTHFSLASAPTTPLTLIWGHVLAKVLQGNRLNRTEDPAHSQAETKFFLPVHFVLSRPPTDWVMFTHIGRSKMLYSVYQFTW